jgi:tRNA(adenine34) deaminase
VALPASRHSFLNNVSEYTGEDAGKDTGAFTRAPTDIHWMEMALKEARLSEFDVPVGCVIVRDEKLFASGHNEKEKSQDPTDHAEIIAIRKASTIHKSWRLDGCILYTTLEPCPMCAEAIMQTRISRLVFGAYDIQSGAVGSKFNLFLPGRPYPVPEVTGGILQEQCQELLVNFFRQRRK